MALSGTYTFDLDTADIIEQAFEDCGLDPKIINAQDLRMARRKLNLVLTAWANRQINLWTLDEETQALTDGTASYVLDSSTVDILDCIMRDSNGTDLPLNRIGIQEYFNKPNKSSKSNRPVEFAVLRGQSAPTIFLWPTPNASAGTLRYYRMRYIQDVGAFTNNVDIPRRFLPALVAALAYEIAKAKPPEYTRTEEGSRERVSGVDPLLRAQLKQDAIELFAFAQDEDRERSSFFVTPYGRRGRR